MSPRIIERWQLVLFEKLDRFGMFRLSTDSPVLRIRAYGLADNGRPEPAGAPVACGHEG